jgi:hypothetical protein
MRQRSLLLLVPALLVLVPPSGKAQCNERKLNTAAATTEQGAELGLTDEFCFLGHSGGFTVFEVTSAGSCEGATPFLYSPSGVSATVDALGTSYVKVTSLDLTGGSPTFEVSSKTAFSMVGFTTGLANSCDLTTTSSGALRSVRGSIGAIDPVYVVDIPGKGYYQFVTGGEEIGTAVAVSGDLLVLGDPGDDTAAADAGAVLFFQFDGNIWNNIGIYGNTDAGARMGAAVAIDGDTAIVGTPHDPTGGTDSGRVVFWKYNGSTFIDVSYHYGSAGDQLGHCVDIEGNQAIAGMPSIASGGTGKAALLTRNGGSWSLTSTWTASDGQVGDAFGTDVAISPSRVAVGSPSHAAGGAAYVYDLAAATSTDLGFAKAGIFGLVPQLSVTGPTCDNVTTTLDLIDANFNSPAFLIVGLSQGNLPFQGGTMAPNPDVILAFGTNGFGSLSLSGPFPTGLPPLSLFLQYWIIDAFATFGWSASNGVQLDVIPL